MFCCYLPIMNKQKQTSFQQPNFNLHNYNYSLGYFSTALQFIFIKILLKCYK